MIRALAMMIAGLTLAVTPVMAAQDKTKKTPLRVVFIAYQTPDQLMEDVEPVVAYLESSLGMKVKAFAATDYAGIVEALRGETADVGFMGPLQYVIAHDQAGAIPVLGEVYNGSATYVSRIFVRKDSKFRSLASLRGKSVAFVDPLSSSGYLYPLNMFKDAGLIKKRDDAERFFKRIYFAGGDEQALRAVLNGFVDAAGIGQYAYSLLRPEERDQITTIGESKPIPSHCVVVRKGLDPAITEKFQQVLLALNDGKNRKLLKHLYSVDGYVPVTHETFADVEQIAKEYGFIKD